MEASGAPVLSTPAEHIFEAPVPITQAGTRLSDEQLYVQYEIRRTVNEIRSGKWKRVALQFPDDMLGDAPRVCENLKKDLKTERKADAVKGIEGVTEGIKKVAIEDETEVDVARKSSAPIEDEEEHLTILGDTSYGACCVDEVAAEHCSAEVVVHYGRSCLSPTARLPVIYVFTTRSLDHESTIATFKATYPDLQEKVVLMADIPFQHHVPSSNASSKTAKATQTSTQQKSCTTLPALCQIAQSQKKSAPTLQRSPTSPSSTSQTRPPASSSPSPPASPACTSSQQTIPPGTHLLRLCKQTQQPPCAAATPF